MDLIISPDELELAVSGLSSWLGIFLMWMMSSWIRMLLDWVDADGSGLTQRNPLSGTALLRSLMLTGAFGFFLLALLKAAGQLRQLRVEAPVFALTVWGLLLGLVLWLVYAVGLSLLRADLTRAQQTRRSTAL